MKTLASSGFHLAIVLFVMATRNTLACDYDFNTTSDCDAMTTSLSYFDDSEITPGTDTASSGFAWYPLRWTWWLLAQTIFAVLGIIGNGVVVVVIYQRYSLIKSTDILIGSLAIGDLLTSIFLFPIPWARKVPNGFLGHLYCKFLYPSFPLWFCITGATYILVGICIERYVAIIYPIYFNRVNSKRTATLFVLVLWLISFLLVVYTLFIFIYDPEIGYCRSIISTEVGRTVQAYYAISIRLFIPIMIMLVSQTLISRSLHIQGKRFSGMTNQEDTGPSFHMVARNRIVKMTLIVVLVYVVCWTPNQIAYLCFNLGYITPSYRGSPLHRILTLVAFLNTCCNPFIYATRNPEFRTAVRDLFLCSKHTHAIDPVFGPSSSTTKESKYSRSKSGNNA